MEKQTRDFEVNYPLGWNDDVMEINKMRKDLDEAERLGATHVKIMADVQWECPILTVEAIARRLETDDEFNARIAEENARQEVVKRRELAELERFKQKYT